MKARQAASGRRAHQMWSILMWPCFTFVSWAEWAETSSIGKATSISRLRRSPICAYPVVLNSTVSSCAASTLRSASWVAETLGMAHYRLTVNPV